jgi:hypothetical protein
LICLLSASTSRVDPRLADAEGLVDDVGGANTDSRFDEVLSEHVLDGMLAKFENSDLSGPDNRRTSTGWPAAARQRLGGGDRDVYSHWEFFERTQLLHGDSRLHFIFRLRHSVHELNSF